ncbi:hypothetical protein SAY86_024389 [Trapa natans]|uniref:C2 NT-type domain-containing protein n=1 Tax=Trapa natans TaxID=22666 RepID=A0AAN7RBG9_TRANT|nr:hypothetical protein SAY86_024389 [Trapa natans]
MVVKMMRWRPWPPHRTRKYEVRLVVRSLRSSDPLPGAARDDRKLTVEVRWRGPKLAIMSSLRRAAVKKNFTREEGLGKDGRVVWEEEFETVCGLTAYKENAFHSWEIGFTLFNVTSQGSRKVSFIGSSSINIAEFASAAEKKEFELSIPLVSPAAESPPLLSVCLGLMELRTVAEASDLVQRQVVPIMSPPQSGEAAHAEKHELSALKAGLQKVKIIKDYVSSRKAKQALCEERCSGQSEDSESNYPIDSDSPDDSDKDGSSDEGNEHAGARKSLSYGSLAYANCVGGPSYSDARLVGECEDWIYYSNCQSDVRSLSFEDVSALASEEPQLPSSKFRILSWRKRKLSFRSPKPKGEPLLKRAYEEDGGDDIDFDRRQLSSDESLSQRQQKAEENPCATCSSSSDFGEDNFVIGSWEHKEIISRDGHMKLQAQVFFASIDQRSERVAGESACTALVAVLADWFHKNPNLMPIKSQLDSLIRDGSLEWRNLCNNVTYREEFPDKHFDLETILQAKIRPLSVDSGKSFIGFFHPKYDMSREGKFEFLEGSLSFDDIWEEIRRVGSEYSSDGDPQVYIVSWNDHFFLLKVEPEAYYIIDSLGERLHEGCDQAYILKFDSDTTISRLPTFADGKAVSDHMISTASPTDPEITLEKGEPEIICKGKDSCQEYIKNFLAAIPIRELQVDIEKGLMGSVPLHQRLQIEFHYTKFLEPTICSSGNKSNIGASTDF